MSTRTHCCSGSTITTALLLAATAGCLLPCGTARGQLDATWKYYRTGNTGVQGDYSDALWIDDGGTLYLGAYVPSFEEGGFARFIESENRWENFSNVDYPQMADWEQVGSARISDFCPDDQGRLWMGTWRGLIFFDPAIGAESLRRFDPETSPLPGGHTLDVDVAPDGTVWLGAYGNGGGVFRYDPATETWTIWDSLSRANGWPGWPFTHATVVQPKPGGGYLVWVDDSFGRAVFDSDTQRFQQLPNTGARGEIMSVLANGGDDVGNVWMLRYTAPGQLYSVDYRRPDGTFVSPPFPFGGAIEIDTFRAFGDGQALMVAGGTGSEAWYFNRSSWSSLGEWRSGGFTYGIDMDAEGNVWVSGVGGAARRDADTGIWQRYRITNTSQMDYWVRDITFADNGDVWVTGNAGPGYGGIGVFDGLRWYNFNIATYGLGGDWPFPTDNADAICYRPSTGNIAFNPMFNGIREWDGNSFITFETGSTSEGLVEDSQGRLWTIGEYYSLRYHDGNGFVSVGIDGWGANVTRDPDRPGTVWACAGFEVVRTDGGAYRFSRETPDFRELNVQHDLFTTVAADRNGVAWLGSSEGLFQLDSITGNYRWFHQRNSTLPIDHVTPLVVTPDGRVWMTDFTNNGFEDALLWFDGTEYGTYTRANGLPHAQIYDAEVRSIEGGYELWLSCASQGIAVLTVMTDTPGLQLGAPTPGLACERNTWSVTGATAGNRVHLVYGLQAGATPVPGCPGLQLDIITSADRIVGSAVANANGEATIARTVPCSARGIPVLFQVADPAACTVSNVVRTTFN